MEGVRVNVSNRDLLADLCGTRRLCFANFYFDKSQRQKITFHGKGTMRTPTLPIDCSDCREIDFTLASAERASTLDNIRSRAVIQVRSSTHIIQEIT